MKKRTVLLKFIWNNLPAFVQHLISFAYTRVYDTKASQLFIKPFCKMHNINEAYLALFQSSQTQNSTYTSFQDFFCRSLIAPIKPDSKLIWPCEGYVCEQGQISELKTVQIKSDKISIKNVFSAQKNIVPDNYFYTNIFLHNQNYHRIHAPISGRITRIEKIPGELSILRPWFYKKNDVSKPALRNERVNIDITDSSQRTWFLSIVGGMAVGTIELVSNIALEQFVDCGQEIALFKLGSTVCLATPLILEKLPYLKKVFVGEPIPTEAKESSNLLRSFEAQA